MSRWTTLVLLVLLGISLALNLFLGGRFLGMGFLGGERGERVSRFVAMASLGPAPPPMRERIEQRIEAEREEVREAFRGVREARRTVREAARAEPFDRARLDEAFTRLRAANDAFQARVLRTVGDAIAQSPAEERRQIGERDDDRHFGREHKERRRDRD